MRFIEKTEGWFDFLEKRRNEIIDEIKRKIYFYILIFIQTRRNSYLIL